MEINNQVTQVTGMGKKSGSGSEMNNPDHISESLKNNFLGYFKILKFFMVDPGFGMEKIRIRSLGRKKVISWIRDKHPGSATLPRSIKKVCKDMQD
jgi:hypothetical protein